MLKKKKNIKLHLIPLTFLRVMEIKKKKFPTYEFFPKYENEESISKFIHFLRMYKNVKKIIDARMNFKKQQKPHNN